MTSTTQLPQAENPTSRKRSRWFGLAWKGVAAIIVVVAIVWALNRGEEPISSGTTFAARRGDLEITVTQGGSIEAEESQTIKNEVKGQTKIIQIVEEGYLVTEQDVADGKILVTLDDNELQERHTQQEIEYQASRANYIEDREQYEIQIKQNESDITTAELNVKFARMDFEKYLGATVALEILTELDLLELPPVETSSLAPEPPPLTAEQRLALEAQAAEEAGAAPGNPGPPTEGAEATTAAAAADQPQGEAEPRSGGGRPEGRPRREGRGQTAPNEGAASSDEPRPDDDAAKPEAPQPAPDSPQPNSDASASPEDVEPAGSVQVGTSPAANNETIDGAGLEMASEISTPTRTVDFTAYADPERLGDGEAQEQLRKLQSDRLLAEEELQLNERNLEGTRRLRERDFVTQQELEADEMKVKRSANTAEASRIAEELFIKYEFPKQAEKLLSDYQEAIRKLVRVRKEAVSNLARAEQRMKSAEATYQLQTARRRELTDQLSKCVIRAERSGLVVYAGSNEPWRRQEPIEEGATVYERQEIITIPDMTKMAATVKIHESAIERVQRGMTAQIRVDARPGTVLTGTVTRIAVLPDSSQRWMNPDLKLYPATVSIEGVYDWLKPGMTAEVEVKVNELKDVVYVPIQAVSPFGDKRVCYVVNAVGQSERRVVETGEFNTEYIEIKSGIQEGDRVLLRAPQTPGKPKPDGTPQEQQAPSQQPPTPQVAST